MTQLKNWTKHGVVTPQGSEFYDNSFKKWLKDNDIEMYSTNNEGKSVVGKRFSITLKTKIYKYMTSISIMCISIS